jgi:cytochrome b6-f complex iron-sulfur subunit
MDDRLQKENERKIHRRAFLKALAASGGAAALAGCAAAAAPEAAGDGAAEVSLDLTQPDNRALAAVGGVLLLEANPVDSKGLLLYRAGENEIRAFSRTCTHSGCVVGGFQDGISSCPCHGSLFGTDGKPIKGPATAPLQEYAAVLDGSILTIRG